MSQPPPNPRYILGREIARGGLGRVVEAFDTELKRTVAVKLMLDDLPAEVRDRFMREAELTARLEHPNVVPVHGLVASAVEGEVQLQLAMKRIQGRDLAALLRDLAAEREEAVRGWSRARLLSMFQDICLGMAFAHDRGVVHRDLKPGNIMIGEYGETLIVDWGLAKDLRGPAAEGGGGRAAAPGRESRAAGWEDRTMVPLERSGAGGGAMTLDGDVMGTPAYMSPEQAEGRLAEIDARSDIYSLGAILYEILTFRTPVDGESLDVLLSRVRSGAIEAPSRRAPVARASGQIPPALDAIVLRALAHRREDRYPSARALHDDIQLFLDGAKEAEQRQAAARERVASGQRWLAAYESLRGEIEGQAKRVKELGETVKAHHSPEVKRPLWEAEEQLRRLGEARIDAFSRASAEFGQALAVEPGNVEAREGKCRLYLDRFLDAERRRDREDMQLNRNALRQYDAAGAWDARLNAGGPLTLRARVRRCGCLAPVRVPGWRVEIGAAPEIPWRDGGPRPGRRPTERDRAVPRVTVFPAGTRWGHEESCPQEELAGVEVWIAKYEERDKRLVLGTETRLGETPLEGVELPQGSYRCTLRPRDPAYAEAYVPVVIGRATGWSQDVALYRRAEIPPGFRFVPGGPFTFGGTWAGGMEEQRLATRDLFVSDFPVTCADYLGYLNALCAAGNLDEARRRQPREADKKWWIEDGGRFRLPEGSESDRFAWDPRWPVFSVDWWDATAYAAWFAGRAGYPCRLLHEEEYEKAARGVDGRIFSFGNEYDGSYAHSSVSLEGGQSPRPVGSFPADESPCGIRDLSGGICSWLWNASEYLWQEWRATRGGAWSTPATAGRAAVRRADAPSHLAWYYGIRLAVPAMNEALS